MVRKVRQVRQVRQVRIPATDNSSLVPYNKKV